MTRRPYMNFQDEETGEYSEQFLDFWNALTILGCMNFDCNQVARALVEGLTPLEAKMQFDQEAVENFIPFDREDALNHDHSMNG